MQVFPITGKNCNKQTKTKTHNNNFRPIPYRWRKSYRVSRASEHQNHLKVGPIILCLDLLENRLTFFEGILGAFNPDCLE